VQPSRSRGRRIVTELRPERPLVYERLSDPILVRRARGGDRLALAALCERHAPRVERTARHMLRDPEDARDAAQEVLVKLVRRLGQFRGQSEFATWLHRVTVNTCKDVAQARWSAARRTEPLVEDTRVSAEGDPVGAAASAETRRELGRCLAGLPAAQATVVALKDAFDVPFDEISLATGLPVGTAKCYAHRGRKGLRQRLTGAGSPEQRTA
jgi:RNA polymerase sigma-70 factor, ECF subfamily